jgi:precorrin-6A/cobalt-precorrin-6A reductase
LLALRRPPWQRVPRDRWTDVADVPAAVRGLGPAPRRVFLALGRQELGPFASAPQHRYLVRSVDPVDPPLAVPHASYLVARGPFAEAAERELLLAQGIDAIVSKNSGGEATYSIMHSPRLPFVACRPAAVPVARLRASHASRR